MLVLIATNELQGTVDGDYAWTVEGELVTPVVVECGSGDRCGCRRGFPGLASARATTTAMVVDRPELTRDDLRDAVRDWLDRGGWPDLLATDVSECRGLDRDHIDVSVEVERIIEEVIDEHVDSIRLVCRSFPVGAIVTRHGDLVRERWLPSVA